MLFSEKMRHIEDSLQKSCVSWFSLQYREYAKLLHHSPNGGKRNAPQVVQSIGEAFVGGFTPEGGVFWGLLSLAFNFKRERYKISEPKKYQGDDDSRAE